MSRVDSRSRSDARSRGGGRVPSSPPPDLPPTSSRVGDVAPRGGLRPRPRDWRAGCGVRAPCGQRGGCRALHSSPFTKTPQLQTLVTAPNERSRPPSLVASRHTSEPSPLARRRPHPEPSNHSRRKRGATDETTTNHASLPFDFACTRFPCVASGSSLSPQPCPRISSTARRCAAATSARAPPRAPHFHRPTASRRAPTCASRGATPPGWSGRAHSNSSVQVRPPSRAQYFDDSNEYRHVILPKHVAKNAPKGRLLSESEWRGLGVQQSRGWVHYAIYRPEPHIMLYR